MKRLLCKALILSLHTKNKEFVVYSDISDSGLGCVLMQRGKLIAYASQQLKSAKMNYSEHDLDIEAVLFTLKL